MRRTAIVLAASTALMFGGALIWRAQAQMERGSAVLSETAKNFTPIEKAACGPHWGRYCPPWHHWVCRRGYWGAHCWCAPC
ncbi:MAG: hypothetical protein JO288_11915 [Hyphomicrobiales bacterium]|nr:hypothetical protein [Hyphomicrobiales bacterium]